MLRLGRLLLAGSRGDAVRITSLALTDLRRYRDHEFEPVARPDDRPRPERGRQVDDPARDRARADAQGHELGRRPRRAGRRGTATPTPAPRSRSTFTYEDEEGEPREGRLAKSFRGSKGQVRLELDGDADHRSRPRRRGAGRALGRPDRGLLPLHGLGPPPRAGRAPARRGRAARPAPGVDQRRRPRDEPRRKRKLERALHDLQTRGVKNPGRLKVAEDAVTDVRLAAPGRRGRARSASSTTATRSPSPASTAPRPRPRSPSGGRCSRRRARPSG